MSEGEDSEISADALYHMILLSFFWRWQGPTTRAGWSTVNKVGRVLCRLGVITPHRRDNLHRSDALQAFFRRRTQLLHLTITAEDLAESPLHFVARVNMGRGGRRVTPQMLLQHHALYLTSKGAEVAGALEERYRHLATRDSFLIEEARDKVELEAEGEAAKRSRFRNVRNALNREEGE